MSDETLESFIASMPDLDAAPDDAERARLTADAMRRYDGLSDDMKGQVNRYAQGLIDAAVVKTPTLKPTEHAEQLYNRAVAEKARPPQPAASTARQRPQHAPGSFEAKWNASREVQAQRAAHEAVNRSAHQLTPSQYGRR